MESDFEVPERRSGTLFADRAFDDRYRDIGRLLITCPDRPEIVAAVSRFLFDSGANIIESQQYSTDPFGGTFFLRVEFHLDDLADHFDDLESQFAPLSESFAMRWRMARAGVLKRAAIFATKADHALQEIMWRVHSGSPDG